MNLRRHPFHRLIRILLLIGPGIFCVGYTIGPGAMTKLAVAGTGTGLTLLWVLPCSCLLFWALAEGYGRYTVTTGKTALHGMRTHLRGGPGVALLLLAGVGIGQWTGLPVLVNVVSQLIYEGLRLVLPSAPAQSMGAVVAIAAVLLGGVYVLLAAGRYSWLERTQVILVAMMLGGFVGALCLVRPAPELFSCGTLTSPPVGDNGSALALSLVGLSLAAPTFLVRSLLVQAKGWHREKSREQRRDAFVSALLLLIVVASALACAAGALHHQGRSIENLFDAVHGLHATCGRLAAGLFLLGVLGAGLSSILPMTMVLPLLIADYRDGELEIRSPQFRRLGALACGVGLSGPVFADRLQSIHRIGSQVAQVFVLPLVVGGVFILLNRPDLMGAQRAGFWLNAGLFAAFGFALWNAGLGLNALGRMLT